MKTTPSNPAPIGAAAPQETSDSPPYHSGGVSLEANMQVVGPITQIRIPMPRHLVGKKFECIWASIAHNPVFPDDQSLDSLEIMVILPNLVPTPPTSESHGGEFTHTASPESSTGGDVSKSPQ